MTWSLQPNSRPQKFLGHKGAVYDVAVNPNGSQIASASKDNTIRLWNNNAEAFSYILKGHSAPVKSIQFNADGQYLLSASDDKTIKMWSVIERKFI
jgi:centriolar protein POC1